MMLLNIPTPCSCNDKQRSIMIRLLMLFLTALIGAGVRHALDRPRLDVIESKIETVDAKIDDLGSIRPAAGKVARTGKMVGLSPAAPNAFEEITPGDIIQDKLLGRRP